MISTLITADLHWSDNPRDEYRFAFINRLLRIIEKHHPAQLVILGDICEEKDRHSARLVDCVVQSMLLISEQCDVYILRGNHDYIEPRYPFFQFLTYFDCIEWINEPKVIDDCLFLPHTNDYKRTWDGLVFSQYDMIFTHMTFTGAQIGGRVLEGVDPNIFPHGARVISGDIHKPQTIGPVTYVGAPYTVDFGDDYEPRVLLLVDDTLTSIKVTGPQKRLVNVQIVDKKLHADPMPNKGDIIKVRAHIAMRDFASWPELRERIRAWAQKRNLVLYTIQPVIEYAVGEREQATILREPKPDETILREYASTRDLDDDTVKAGLNLMRKAK